jgi:hypothetical protein
MNRISPAAVMIVVAINALMINLWVEDFISGARLLVFYVLALVVMPLGMKVLGR